MLTSDLQKVEFPSAVYRRAACAKVTVFTIPTDFRAWNLNVQWARVAMLLMATSALLAPVPRIYYD
jgi:hypothetical protein